MQYHRKWEIDHGPQTIEELDRPEGWGQSFFYYCRRCKFIYANATLAPSDGTSRIWRAVSGLCANCPGDRWTIPGTLECNETVGWNLPHDIVTYQLFRELIFLQHSQHPYNVSELNQLFYGD